jgi:hypothetical protein
MKSCFRWFNIYFALFGVFFSPGCASDNSNDPKKEQAKEQSTIRLYLEGHKVDTASTGTVLVTRQKFPYTVEREPFLTEADLSKVSLIDDPSGQSYSIQLLFDDHGALFLDMTTTANKGRHIIVFSQFPIPGAKQPKAKRKSHAEEDEDEPMVAPLPPPESTATNQPRQSAWLAAVLIRERNSSGLFRFTPDASHEEGVRIVRGLKNVIATRKRRDKY